MLFIINNQGKVLKQDTAPIHQYSHKADTIYLLAPFVPTANVRVVFNMPNGDNSQSYIMTSCNELATEYEEYSGLSMWRLDLTMSVTKYAGLCGVQFFVYLGTCDFSAGDTEIEGSALATARAEFNIQKGVSAVDNFNEDENDLLTKACTVFSFFNEIKDELSEEVENLSQEIRESVENLSEEVSQDIQELKQNAGNIFNGLREDVDSFLDEIKQGAENLSDEVKQDIQKLSEEVDNLSDEIIESVENLSDEVKQDIQELSEEVDNLSDEIIESVENLSDEVKQDIQELKQNVKSLPAELRAEVKEDIENLYALSKLTNLYTVSEIEDSYNHRTVADGENVIDGTFARIKTVTGTTVKSKNLFNADLALNDNFTKNNNGTFTLAQNAKNREPYYYESAKVDCVIPANTQFTISVKYRFTGLPSTATSIFEMWIRKDDSIQGESIKSNKGDYYATSDDNGYFEKTYLFDESVKTIYFGLNTSPGGPTAQTVTIDYIQIEKGATATEYKPYFTGLKSSHFKGISVYKNIFNPAIITPITLNGSTHIQYDATNDYIVLNGAYGMNTRKTLKQLCPALNVGDTVTLTAFYDSTYTSNIRCIYLPGTVSDSPLRNWGYGQTKTITADALNSSVCFYGTGNIRFYIDKRNVVATDYLPYKPVDKLETEEAIETGLGVTVDFENQEIIKQYAEVVLTGEEPQIKAYDYTGTDGVVAHGIDFGQVMPTQEQRAKGICTDCEKIGDYYKTEALWLGVSNSNRTIFWVGILDKLGLSTVEEFKAWLANRYAQGNPVTIRYITSEVQEVEQLNVVNTYKVYNGGTEIVIQGENDNSIYGNVDNTLTQEYYTISGGTTNE